MTIGNIIDKTRIQLRLQSDDARQDWSDELIYSHLLDVRALLIERDLEKWKKVSLGNWQGFCMKMENVKDDCNGCLQNDCYVLQSKYKLPGTMGNVLRDMVRIFTPAGEEVWPGGFAKFKRERYSRQNKHKLYYELHNNFIRVFGTTEVKTLKIRILAEDPLDLMDIPVCTEDGIEQNALCFNPLTEDFPMDRSLVTYMIEFMVKRIVGGLSIEEDVSNDAQSNPEPPKSYSRYPRSTTMPTE